ncbi:hypothetical protein LEMLEM_LOCUS11216, partial [Lemmus lemmus]
PPWQSSADTLFLFSQKAALSGRVDRGPLGRAGQPVHDGSPGLPAPATMSTACCFAVSTILDPNPLEREAQMHSSFINCLGQDV